MSDTRATALAALAAGLSPIPIQPGGKVPLGEWKEYQRKAMQPADVDRLFRNGCGIGLVCGAVSGNLELLDFDAPELFRPFGDTLESIAPDLRGRLTTWQETPSGGYHLVYRCSGTVGGNAVLARGRGGKAAIETRGEGGQFLIAPSRATSKQDGELHPYTLHGDLGAIPTITEAERDLIHSIARSFDEGGHQEQEHQGGTKASGTTGGDRPGDHFNAETDWSALLTGYGWRHLKATGGREHWQRPGKTGPQASATLRFDIEAGFWAFTTSTPLPVQKPLTKFAVFTYMEHDGDFAAAARALAARYGTGGTDRHDHTGPAEDQGHQEQAEPEEWEPPVDLDTPDLPGFTAADFPATLWAMIEGIARATETPPELAGMNVLAVAATACQRRLKIELDPGYVEPLNLWTLTALPPGSRKSAVQRLAIAPLQSWEIERGQAMAPEIKEAEATRAAGALRIKELQKRYAKEQDEGKRSTLLEEITTAEAALPEVPRKPRVFGQDVTAEKTGALLATYGEKIGIFSAEGGIFDILAGRYSAGVPNMDVFLQAHAGDQVRVDRGSRPPVDLQEPALSMGLSIQPSVLHEMAGKAAFRGRGLIGRFLFAVPADIVGKRTLETVPVSPSVRAGYDQAITTLLDLPEQRNMLTGELFAIQLTPEAHADWKAFAREVETGMAEGGPLESLRDWAGKLPGAAGRIAGVFHCIEHAGRLLQEDPEDLFPPTPDHYPLTGATMRTALSLARKLLAHAVFVYGIMGEDEGIWAARRILRWIRNTNAEGFSVNECYRALRGTFPKRADLDPGLLTLAERNYLRRERPPAARKPGRPSERYQVNPATWTRQKGF
jgi:hypothetical protein